MAVIFQDSGFLLQNLMEQMSDFIYFKDTKSRFIMVNRAFCEWVKLPPEQIMGKTDFDLFAQEHAQKAFNDEQKIMATGEPVMATEEKEVWNDGHITWVSTTKMPLKDVKGHIIGTFGLSRNITKHKEAEFRATHYSKQIKRIKEEMEEDVRMAGELQKTFFPNSYPVIPLGASEQEQCIHFHHQYHTDNMVCGDFCSVRQLSDTQISLFLCDVMGHGVRAALGTALICAIVEEDCEQQFDPGKYLNRVNELLLPILRKDDVFLYTTASYIVIDVETGILKSANAGHPIPMHFCKQKGTVEWLMNTPDLRGPALAIMEKVEYLTIEKKINIGDSVVMYTDGLYEALGPNEEEFSEERLIATAKHHIEKSLPDLFTALINAARDFSANNALNDDVCLIGFTLNKLMNGN